MSNKLNSLTTKTQRLFKCELRTINNLRNTMILISFWYHFSDSIYHVFGFSPRSWRFQEAPGGVYPGTYNLSACGHELWPKTLLEGFFFRVRYVLVRGREECIRLVGTSSPHNLTRQYGSHNGLFIGCLKVSQTMLGLSYCLRSITPALGFHFGSVVSCFSYVFMTSWVFAEFPLAFYRLKGSMQVCIVIHASNAGERR